jgi:hypothetical protein
MCVQPDDTDGAADGDAAAHTATPSPRTDSAAAPPRVDAQ